MDIQALCDYEDLMAKCRRNPPAPGVYCEKHHEVPFCMGGSDDADNIVRVIPEDHIEGHLLLAKAFDLPKLWQAVRLMCLRASIDYTHTKNLRERFGAYKREAAEKIRGDNHPNNDRTIRNWKHHPSGRTFNGTTRALSNAVGIPRGRFSLVTTNRTSSCFGWYLSDKYAEFPSCSYLRMWRAEIVKIKHVDDGRVLEGPRPLVCKQAGVPSRDLGKMLLGKCTAVKGWTRFNTDLESFNIRGGRIRRGSKIHATLIHPIYGEFTGNASDFANKHYRGEHDASSALAALVRGKRPVWRDWRLAASHQPPEFDPNKPIKWW